MANPSAAITRVFKLIGGIGLAVVGVTVAVNQFIRVSGPGDEESTGIVSEWLGSKLRSDNFRNWEASAKYSGLGIDLLVKHGADVIVDDTIVQDDRVRAIRYLNMALDAANKVDKDYLQSSHPSLPVAYSEYREGLELFLLGAEKKDLRSLRLATALYNGFLTFMKVHKDEFRLSRNSRG